MRFLDNPFISKSFLLSVQTRLLFNLISNTYRVYIGSYFPEVCAFGTLIVSTKVFRLTFYVCVQKNA